MLAIVCLFIGALVGLAVGSFLKDCSQRGVVRHVCGAGHVWYVREDDELAMRRVRVPACPWCLAEP